MTLIRIILLLFVASTAWAGSCPTTITSGTTFPCALDSAATYTLSENISCTGSCLFVTTSGVTLDGNSKTMTFGTDNNPGISDPVFETWTDASTLTNWTLVSGSVARVASTWPEKTYDAELSATGSIKSGNVTINAGQTYVYYAIIKGSSSDSYTVGIYRTSDDAELAATTITTPYIENGYGISNGTIHTQDQNYKPSTNTQVYLKITGIGSTATKRIAMADIKPSNHYGIASHNYQSGAFPDNTDATLYGAPTNNLLIKDLTITQGSGQAVKSAAIYLRGNGQTGTIQNVTISMTGRNTASLWIEPVGNIVVDTVSTTTTSNANLNRQSAPSDINLTVSTTASGTVEVKNSTFLNYPGQGIGIGGDGGAIASMPMLTNVHNNTIRNKEFVTNGYAIGVWNIANVDIYSNTIQPYRGRGIITDTSGYGAYTKNLTIRYNDIKDIYELPLMEFGADGLEAAGIRIRNWGDNAMQNVVIHSNNIEASADANGVHACYGINVNAYHADDQITIRDNTITVSATGTDRYGVGIAMQVADMAGSSYPLLIYNNTIAAGAQSYGLMLGGADTDTLLFRKARIYNNAISASYHPFYLSSAHTISDVDIYCNTITNSGTAYYPFYMAGTISDFRVSYNSITSSNSGGYEAYAASAYADAVFCETGTIDVNGGGSVGSASAPCQDGSANCYASAGTTYTGEYGSGYVPTSATYTHGALNVLPSTTTDLSTTFGSSDVTAVASSDDSRVTTTGTGTAYVIQQFKSNVGSAASVNIRWEGQTKVAASASTVYLQCYNKNTSTWDTMTSNSTASANTDFVMTYGLSNLTNYADGGVLTCRVYQKGN